MKPIQVAVAGLGGFAGQHHAALAALEKEGECQVVATCDPNFESMPGQVARYDLTARNVALHKDLESLLKQHTPDLVTLPTPIPLHAAQHRAVIESGAACYLEKPPTLDLKEFEEMVEVDAKAKFATQVGFNFIGDPFRQALRARIHQGEFGLLKVATLLAIWPRDRAYYQRNDWAGRLRLGDQWVQDSPLGNAIAHYVQNLLSWADAQEIHAVESALYRAHPIESFDTAFIRAQAGQTELRIALTHLGTEGAFERETLHFEAATIRFPNWRTAQIEYPDGRQEPLESPYQDQFQVLRENLRHTFRYLRGQEPAPITPLPTCRPFVTLNALAYQNAKEIQTLRPTAETEAGQRQIEGLPEAMTAFIEKTIWPFPYAEGV